MGSATREALASAIAALEAGKADLATGEQLLTASRVINGSAQLRTVLADDGAPDEDKRAVITTLFGGYSATAKSVLENVASGRWSSPSDLVAAVEEVGIRAIAASAPKSVDITAELFTFARAIASDSELELAVGSKLGLADVKVSIVDALLKGKASDQTLAIVRQLVQDPRGRRVGELLRFASTVVADQAGLAVATVTSATAIAPAQLKRLSAGLARQYGRELWINLVLDPTIIGGLRVQIGDDVIDGSVARKINDLRLQLAR